MIKNPLTFLQIGLGSMGKRRIRNLIANGEKNIIGFDFSGERRKEAEEKYGIKTIEDLNEISVSDFDAVIISTPPNQHGDYIRFALQNKKHFFTEVATSDDGYKEIFKNTDTDIVAAPSCTFRYFLPVRMIKKLLAENRIGRILAFQHHNGQYLPDWHPWEDYRKVYFAKKETGACREILPYDLIWLNWLVNSEIDGIFGYITKVSDLDMEADDLIMSSVKYKNNIFGNIIIDAISRKPFVTLRILGDKGVLEWDCMDSIIKLYNGESKSSETIKVPKGNPETGYLAPEEMYIDEIKAFLDAVRGRTKYPYSFEEDVKNLQTLYQLELKQ
ncbi:MAG: Gfo/Idh/MocA family oxidoreductase [Candidatus Niyogibacteria bacterium]|nr:Gfo/Idh/MocA family oxidoreductase [Candidatus Niyogibacteria bacterium]